MAAAGGGAAFLIGSLALRSYVSENSKAPMQSRRSLTRSFVCLFLHMLDSL